MFGYRAYFLVVSDILIGNIFRLKEIKNKRVKFSCTVFKLNEIINVFALPHYRPGQALSISEG
jgi:hypothetical protein